MTSNKEIVIIAVIFCIAVAVVIMDVFFWRAV